MSTQTTARRNPHTGSTYLEYRGHCELCGWRGRAVPTEATAIRDDAEHQRREHPMTAVPLMKRAGRDSFRVACPDCPDLPHVWRKHEATVLACREHDAMHGATA